MNQTFEQLMRTADPARDVAPLGDDRRESILDAATGNPAIAGRLHRHPVRWMAAAAALVLVVSGAGIALSGPTAAEALADEVLETAAINAQDPAVQPGQYWEITTAMTAVVGTCPTEHDDDCYNGYVLRTTHTKYVEVTGSLPNWHVEHPEQVVEVLDPRDEGALVRDETSAWTSNVAPNDFPGGWQETSPAWIAQLPRDSKALRERLYADSHGTDESALTYARDLLRTGLVPADLRAALFEVIASIPGMVVTEEAATVDGREGVAIGRMVNGAPAFEMIIDPAAGQVIAERRYSDDPEISEWDTGTTYDRQLVDAIPEEISEIAIRQVCTVATDGSTTTTCE